MNQNNLLEGSVVFLNQYSYIGQEWIGHDLYESILVALKEKYSDKLVFKVHPETHPPAKGELLNWWQAKALEPYNIRFAKKHNLKIYDSDIEFDSFIENNVDNIMSIYSLDSLSCFLTIKHKIPTYHLFGIFLESNIPHPFPKGHVMYRADSVSGREWEYPFAANIAMDEDGNEKEVLVKWDDKILHERRYLSVKSLSEIGSIDNVFR